MKVDYDKKPDEEGILSGFTELDALMGGFRPGSFNILGSRPSVGRSTLALNMALNAIMKNKSTAYFSFGRPANTIVQQLIISHADIDVSRCNKRNLSKIEMGKLEHTLGILPMTDFHIIDKLSLDIEDVSEMAKSLKAEDKLDCLIVEDLQVLALPKDNKGGVFKTLHDNISYTSYRLKELALELNIPILVLSQLSRKADRRIDSTPQIHDLKESGSLEYDADVIMLLSRCDYLTGDEVYNPEDPRPTALCLAKNSFGNVGKISLDFYINNLRFESTP
jgi:replicative DNA helicase